MLNRTNFVKIYPEIESSKKLNSSDKLFISKILSYQDDNKNLVFFESTTTISENLGISIIGVKKMLERLSIHEWFIKQNDKLKNDYNKYNNKRYITINEELLCNWLKEPIIQKEEVTPTNVTEEPIHQAEEPIVPQPKEYNHKEQFMELANDFVYSHKLENRIDDIIIEKLIQLVESCTSKTSHEPILTDKIINRFNQLIKETLSEYYIFSETELNIFVNQRNDKISDKTTKFDRETVKNNTINKYKDILPVRKKDVSNYIITRRSTASNNHLSHTNQD